MGTTVAFSKYIIDHADFRHNIFDESGPHNGYYHGFCQPPAPAATVKRTALSKPADSCTSVLVQTSSAWCPLLSLPQHLLHNSNRHGLPRSGAPASASCLLLLLSALCQ
jgi:hypothetical protein